MVCNVLCGVQCVIHAAVYDTRVCVVCVGGSCGTVVCMLCGVHEFVRYVSLCAV